MVEIVWSLQEYVWTNEVTEIRLTLQNQILIVSIYTKRKLLTPISSFSIQTEFNTHLKKNLINFCLRGIRKFMDELRTAHKENNDTM